MWHELRKGFESFGVENADLFEDMPAANVKNLIKLRAEKLRILVKLEINAQ